jgi:hypothetical protein
LRCHLEARLRRQALDAQPLEQMSHIVCGEDGVGNRCGTGERLVPPRRQLAHERPVGADTHEDEVAWCLWSRVDGVTGSLQREQHLVALVGGIRVLNLVGMRR